MTEFPEGPALIEESVLRSHRVLLVDDEPANLTVLELSLQKEFDIVCAESGQDALDIVEQGGISVIICDHMMPGLTGIDVCESIRRSHPEIERIILTAYGDSDILLDAINRGRVSRFLLKPWNAAELSFALREAIYRLEMRREIQRMRDEGAAADRLAALELGASGVLHDLNNGLQRIFNDNFELRTQLDVDEVDVAEARATHNRVMQEIEHISAMIEKAKAPSRPQAKAELQRVLSRALEALKISTSMRGVALRWSCPADTWVRGDATHVRRIVSNLVGNAIQALQESRGSGEVRVDVTRGEAGAVYVRVVDDGPGVPESLREQLFKPGTTSREETGGTGLGLAICAQLAAASGGEVSLEYSSGEGSCFLLTLHAVEDEDKDEEA